jgi:DNA-binding transcriptional LysR family regulator
MDRFEEMRIFVRIMERLSFTDAAEDLQIPRATVTNAVKRLETRLGTCLLERTTRHVSPTVDGQAHYQRCRRLLADLEESESAYRICAPRGLLRVNLQGTLARHFVVPALPAFFAHFPDMELHIGEGDCLADLMRDGVDCVLRAGEMQDASMVRQRVALLEQVTVASPDYLARFGQPHTLEELSVHRAVNYVSSANGKPFPFDFTVDGKSKLIALGSQVSVSGSDIYTAACLAGLGLVQVPRYRVEGELASGQLQLVLPDCPPRPMPVNVLYPRDRHQSARVRTFADWLCDLFVERRSPTTAEADGAAESRTHSEGAPTLPLEYEHGDEDLAEAATDLI